MSYTCTVSGFVIYNAAASCMTVEQMSNKAFFYTCIEETFNIKLLKRDIIDTLKWQYIVEFNSDADAAFFLLRFS